MERAPAQIVPLLQDYCIVVDRLVQEFARRNTMHPTDLYALLAVMRASTAGADLTPGRLGAVLGLSSGATTAVLDRLGRRALLDRQPDETDKRRTTLRPGPVAADVCESFFGPLGPRMDALIAGFREDEIESVARFLGEIIAMLDGYRAEVQGVVGA